jgi:thiol-disulfide isomerase/thioredoxin
MQEYSIADAYAQVNDRKKVLEYARKFTDPSYRDLLYSLLAQQMLKNNDLVTSEYLIKQALDSAKTRMLSFDSSRIAATANPRQSNGNLQNSYYSYKTTYAKVLFKKGKVAEAYTEVKEAYNHSTKDNVELNDFYMTVLLSLNKMNEALPLMENAIRLGLASQDVKSKLKGAYVAVHGSEDGFTGYKEKLEQELYEKTREKVTKLIIDKPSLDFTLTDVSGVPVSLHDLKGKTVVLDFWATWCGPCKKSFPAMQLAVDKYKDDPNVKFLFIHTWERGNLDPAIDAKKYITDHHYSFEVLVDRKNPETGINKVVSDYGVSGIPTKFVIDGSGVIRFEFSGFYAGDDAALAEISSMIEMCKKS